ncbi:MAG: PQQ-dependent sugar dehydrogenase [Pseudanabaenaceae cyanobacterium bins.39]|nr:PQQ-dependent sugar dehydrogenase [Pseudanabaenaceae cyanobacterium bins.39]
MNIFKTITGITACTIAFVISGSLSSCNFSEASSDRLVTTPTASQATSPAQAISAPTKPIALQKVTLIDNLERPWGMAWLPDGSILITERVGRVQLWRDGKMAQVPVNLPDLFVSGQGGLMDIALHPQFAENKFVYLTFAAGNAQSNRTRLLRAKFDGKTLVNPEVIFEVSPSKSGSQHFGSRITWLTDGTMLLAIGDGGNPPLQLNGELIRNQAQKMDSHLGKILRLKDDGSIPADNPFAQIPNANPAVWSYGHRNIQGLVTDRSTGKIWSTEHGARGGDELNLVTAGQNYGWPIVTHSQEYAGGEISSERSRSGMLDPQIVWTPAIAPSGLMIYQGDRFPQWQGHLFAGGLVSRNVIRISFNAQNQPIQEAIPIGQRVRDVREGQDGLIYVLTDEQNGQLIRLEPQS